MLAANGFVELNLPPASPLTDVDFSGRPSGARVADLMVAVAAHAVSFHDILRRKKSASQPYCGWNPARLTGVVISRWSLE